MHDFMILAGSVRREENRSRKLRAPRSVRSRVSWRASPFSSSSSLRSPASAWSWSTRLAESPWGTFTVGFTIPLALFMGLYMYKLSQGQALSRRASSGSLDCWLAVYLGGRVADSSLGANVHAFAQAPSIILMASYGFIASVLPVWMLLCPRDYLSSYLKNRHHRVSDSWA